MLRWSYKPRKCVQFAIFYVSQNVFDKSKRWKTTLVSMSRLNALLHLHLTPINLIIYKEAKITNLEVCFALEMHSVLIT